MNNIVLVDNDAKHLQLLKGLLDENLNTAKYNISTIEIQKDDNALVKVKNIIDGYDSTSDYTHVIVDIFLSGQEESFSSIQTEDVLYKQVSSGMQLASDIKDAYEDIFGKRLVISLMSIYVVVDQKSVNKMKGYPNDLKESDDIKNEFHYIRKPITLEGENDYKISQGSAFGYIDWRLFEEYPDGRTREYAKAFCNIATRRLQNLTEAKK